MHIFRSIQEIFHSRTKNFWLFELSTLLHLFGFFLTSIFIPILLYQVSFSLQHILLYLIFFHLFNTPLNLLAGKLTFLYGTKKIIAWATLSNILFLVLISLALENNNLIFLIFISFFAALYDALYYVASLYIFTQTTQSKKNSTINTTILHIISSLSNLLAPISGSLILLFWNNNSLLLYISIGFFILSLWPLYTIPSTKTKPTHAPITFKKFFKSKREKNIFLHLSLFRFGTGVEYFLWPLYIFFTFGTMESVAYVALLISLSGLTILSIHSFLKETWKKKVIWIGSLALTLIWFLRIILDLFPLQSDYYQLFITLSTFFSSVIFSLLALSTDSPIFYRAKKSGPLASSIYKNFFSMFSKFILFSILFLLTLFLDNDRFVFISSFALSFLSFLMLFIIAKKEWKKNEKMI